MYSTCSFPILTTLIIWKKKHREKLHYESTNWKVADKVIINDQQCTRSTDVIQCLRARLSERYSCLKAYIPKQESYKERLAKNSRNEVQNSTCKHSVLNTILSQNTTTGQKISKNVDSWDVMNAYGAFYPTCTEAESVQLLVTHKDKTQGPARWPRG